MVKTFKINKERETHKTTCQYQGFPQTLRKTYRHQISHKKRDGDSNSEEFFTNPYRHFVRFTLEIPSHHLSLEFPLSLAPIEYRRGERITIED